MSDFQTYRHDHLSVYSGDSEGPLVVNIAGSVTGNHFANYSIYQYLINSTNT